MADTISKLSFWKALKANRRALYVAIAILALGFASKLIRLQVPSTFYFDEVYHGFTARAYVDGDVRAYDPWAKSPEGFAYEWTHPPLAKLVMAGFMWVFGKNFFWMRFGSALSGTLAVLFTGWLAFSYLGSLSVALTAMALFSLETLLFAQSRIAMNDSYFVCLMLATLVVYMRMRKSVGMSFKLTAATAFMAGLALGTKWTGFYLIGIIGLDQIYCWWRGRERELFLDYVVRAATFVVVVILAYLVCYIHYFSMNYTWAQFEELQRQMWWYHNSLKATHAYQSKPWQWILNLKPVWMYVDYAVENKVGNIYNAGNSVVLLGGLLSVVYLLRDLFLKLKHKQHWAGPGFLLFCYFALWLPWVYSPRIMLFYHYLPAVPFLCILLAYTVEKLPKPKQTRNAFLVAALGWFILFYPYAADVRVSRSFTEHFYQIVFPR